MPGSDYTTHKEKYSNKGYVDRIVTKSGPAMKLIIPSTGRSTHKEARELFRTLGGVR